MVRHKKCHEYVFFHDDVILFQLRPKGECHSSGKNIWKEGKSNRGSKHKVLKQFEDHETLKSKKNVILSSDSVFKL